MDRLLTIGEASKLLGVSITTLRRWDANGNLKPVNTVGKHRRYLLSQINPALCRDSVLSSIEEDLAKDILAAIETFITRYKSFSDKVSGTVDNAS